MFSQGILFVCILIGTVWVAVESEEAELIFFNGSVYHSWRKNAGFYPNWCVNFYTFSVLLRCLT